MISQLNLEIVRGTTFGPLEIRCKDAAGAAVPLAGWSARAQIRLSQTTALIRDLNPVIAADDAEGLITLSEIPWETTEDMAPGVFRWDLILQTPEGKRLSPPLVGGSVTVSLPITQ